MIYAKDQKPKSSFVSVNTLIQPQKKNSKSQVMKAPHPTAAPVIVPNAQAQQKSDKVEKEAPELEELQLQSFTAAAARETSEDPGLDTKLQNFRGGGEALPGKVQAQLGPALGTDLSKVRVQRDEPAAALAESMGARAFTNRENIFFNRGEYNPNTPAGTNLLAHELAHVQQQQSVPGLQYQLQNPAERNRYEREADAVAERVVNSPVQPEQKHISSGVNQSSRAGVQLAEAKGKEPNWLLEKVSGLVRNLPGYDLLTMVIGADPLSGRAVKRDGAAMVKAVMGLIPGGALLFTNLEQAKVISKAAAWFGAEFQKLNISLNTIKNLFHQAWDSLSAWDLLNLGGAFEKVKQIFLTPVNRIKNFVAKAGPKLMEFIFEGAMALAGNAGTKIIGILNQGKGVLQQIINDPMGFLKNLITAVRTGLGNFLSHLGGYLQTGLAGWLFGTLGKAGITLPAKLNLAGIFSLMAQILGVTWQAIKAQVVKRLGPTAEKVMEQVEKGIAMVTAFITKGPIALMEMAQEFLGELQALFFDTFIGWLRNTVIGKAVQKLISMFNPVGALIQGVITIYNMIQFFMERAKQIATLVSAVFNSIAEIAAGNLKKAVAAVEDSLAKALPVAIGFLANLVGIGGLAAKIKEIIQKIRQPIDKAVGRVVGFIAGKAKALIGKLTGVDQPREEAPKNEREHDAQVEAGLAAIDGEERKYLENNEISRDNAEKVAVAVKKAYPVFKAISVVDGGETWDYDYVASPGRRKEGHTKKESDNKEESQLTKEQLATRPKYAHEPEYWQKRGGRISIAKNGTWTYHDWEGNFVSYPNGYPDFKSAEMVIQEVQIGKFESYDKDFPKADELAPKGPKAATSTWHHHQDGTTMQEIDRDLHRRFTHVGGMSSSKK